MDEKTKKVITKFIKQKFPIKRIRGDKAKWMRVIITPSGYVRQDRKIYQINTSQISHESITSDIIETVCYVFGFNQTDVEPLVRNYVKSLKL